jgi:hypothetical protein
MRLWERTVRRIAKGIGGGTNICAEIALIHQMFGSTALTGRLLEDGMK